MPRLYSLYRKVSEAPKRYERIPGAGAYPKANAIRIFQNQLLDGAFSGRPVELRPVPEDKVHRTVASSLPVSERMCIQCVAHLHTQCYGGECQCNCRALNGR